MFPFFLIKTITEKSMYTLYIMYNAVADKENIVNFFYFYSFYQTLNLFSFHTVELLVRL